MLPNESCRRGLDAFLRRTYAKQQTNEMGNAATFPANQSTVTKEESPNTGGTKNHFKYNAAQRDFGPCGRVIMTLQESQEPDLDLVFGLKACLQQHLDKHAYDRELTLKMETMVLVFGDPSPKTPSHAVAAEKRAREIDWIEKMKET